MKNTDQLLRNASQVPVSALDDLYEQILTAWERKAEAVRLKRLHKHSSII